MNILVVGNITKDVYLNLDERRNNFEKDAEGINWLNLGFNGETHNFFGRTSVYGGAVVTLEILKNFGLQAGISGAKVDFVANEVKVEEVSDVRHRYILCKDDQITYLTPSARSETIWVNPAESVDWLFVDRSALLSKELAQKIRTFLSVSTNTKLAVYADKTITSEGRKLLELAELIFADYPLPDNLSLPGKLFSLSENGAKFQNLEREWKLEDVGLMTHLTMFSIVSGTIFAALLTGKSEEEALRLAQVNIEGSNLYRTLGKEQLESAKPCKKEQCQLELMAAGYIQNLKNQDKSMLPKIKSGQQLQNGVKKDSFGISEQLKIAFENGTRFASWRETWFVHGYEGLNAEIGLQKKVGAWVEKILSCQKAGIVPVIEPEIVFDGHASVADNTNATATFLEMLFKSLQKGEVSLPGCLFRFEMKISNDKHKIEDLPEKIAIMMAKNLQNKVPSEIAGIIA